jgi:membrane peptidoglycan carboxypeptidase
VHSGGTATNAAMPDGRPIIGKTGTTNAAQSAFFIGSIPQYTLAVGIFSNKQDGDSSHQSLNLLGGLAGGGYGGDWPSMIWRTYAEQEFAPLQVENFATPSFGGYKWNLLGPLLAPKPRKPKGCRPINPFCKRGHPCQGPLPLPLPLPGCPSPSPSPSPSPTGNPTPTPTKTHPMPRNSLLAVTGLGLAARRISA